VVDGLRDVELISAGGGHSVAVLADGSLWTWGFNDRGQLGDGTFTDNPTPRRVEGVEGAVAVAAGYHHTIALLPDGTLLAWGLNDRGQLGDGTREHRNRPGAVTGIDDVIAISSNGGGTDAAPGNGGHNVAVRRDGSVWGWGFNGYGQLGIDTEDSVVPVPIPGISRCRLVSAGGEIPPVNKFEENSGGGFTVAVG
jgi:alpha-tubulin suppressor-like RCC1 family protein